MRTELTLLTLLLMLMFLAQFFTSAVSFSNITFTWATWSGFNPQYYQVGYLNVDWSWCPVSGFCFSINFVRDFLNAIIFVINAIIYYGVVIINYIAWAILVVYNVFNLLATIFSTSITNFANLFSYLYSLNPLFIIIFMPILVYLAYFVFKLILKVIPLVSGGSE